MILKGYVKKGELCNRGSTNNVLSMSVSFFFMKPYKMDPVFISVL